MEREPENVAFFARSLTPVPRSLLRNRTETLTTQANQMYCSPLKIGPAQIRSVTEIAWPEFHPIASSYFLRLEFRLEIAPKSPQFLYVNRSPFRPDPALYPAA